MQNTKKKPVVLAYKQASVSQSFVFDPRHKSVKIAVLTFDDGPSIYTPRLLEILHKYDVRATFFMLGTRIEQYPDIITQMLKHKQELANHSYSHKNLTTLDGNELSYQFAKPQALLKDNHHYHATLFRPPYGAIDEETKKVVTSDFVLWNVDSSDWRLKKRDLIVKHVVDALQPHSTILLHDIYEESVESIDTLIPQLQKLGYLFYTAGEYQDLMREQ
ncbi:MAG: polysaccharide deacetylase family protein [Breznakia sp.]